MTTQDEIINAQLTLYFQKVISNAATSYYKKKFKRLENEVFCEELLDELSDTKEINLPTVIILNHPFYIENEEITDILSHMNKNEQVFVIEKFFITRLIKKSVR